MKKIILSILFVAGLVVNANSQQTTDFFPASNSIWIEDFSGYANETGVATDGGAIVDKGDYDSSFTKWKINSTNVDATKTIIASVQNLNSDNVYTPSFNVANSTGDLEWESEEIDVSAYAKTHLSVVFENEGNIDVSEYVDVYWKVVNVGNYILIDDDNIGHTAAGVSTEECWKTRKVFKDLTVTTPGKVQVKVVFKSTDINNILKLKKVEVLGYN